MVRKKLITTGKFFLYNRKGRKYLHSKGIRDDGAGPEPYTHWTPYFAGAQGFDSKKAAEAMRRKLAEEGDEVSIVTAERRC